MSLEPSVRDKILKYIRELGRVDARQISKEFGISYSAAKYHLEKLAEAKMIKKGEEEIGKLKHIWYTYEIHRGISVTYNVKTKPSKREKPILDITLTLQTVIVEKEEDEILKLVDSMAEIWFKTKFGEVQGYLIKPEFFKEYFKVKEAKICPEFREKVIYMPKHALDYWSPTFEQINKYASIYAFYWCWSRDGREESLEGEELKWLFIPVGPTAWATSRRGRRPYASI